MAEQSSPAAPEGPSEPPAEAVEHSEGTQWSASAQVASAQGHTAQFITSGISEVHLNVWIEQSADSADGALVFGVNGQSAGVRQQAPEVDQSAFSLIADGERLDPEGTFSYVPETAAPQGQEENEGQFSFPGAPERGLLVYESPDSTDAGPVGICFDAATPPNGIFHPRYEECT